MTHKMPPVPPGNRSPKGPGEPARRLDGDQSGGQMQAANPDKVGQSGNSKINTTHQGHQQDR